MKVSIKRKIVIKVKELISNIVLFFLYRGVNVVSKVDPNVKREVESWKEGFTVKVQTCENGPGLILKKKNGKIIKIKKADNYDIEIIFKNLDSAFLVLTARAGISKAYAQHRFILKGNIIEAMSLVRCIDIVETYLFPKIIAKNLVKQVDKLNVPRLITYLRVIVNY